MTITQRRRSLAAALLTAAILLTGCSASSSGSSSHPQADSAVQPAAGATDSDAVEIITGTIAMTAKDPIEASRAATTAVTDVGGRIEDRDEYAADDAAYSHATLTARVPVARIDDVRTTLATIGTVVQTNLKTENVGSSQRDLQARAASLRTSVDRYETWLAAASNPTDLTKLEESLSERQTQLESIESELRATADQVAMSTITLQIDAPDTARHTGPPADLGDAIARGWQSFAAFWTATLLNVVVALPWLVLLALCGAAAVVIVRTRRARAIPAPVMASARPAAPRPPERPGPDPGDANQTPHPPA